MSIQVYAIEGCRQFHASFRVFCHLDRAQHLGTCLSSASLGSGEDLGAASVVHTWMFGGLSD